MLRILVLKDTENAIEIIKYLSFVLDHNIHTPVSG